MLHYSNKKPALFYRRIAGYMSGRKEAKRYQEASVAAAGSFCTSQL